MENEVWKHVLNKSLTNGIPMHFSSKGGVHVFLGSSFPEQPSRSGMRLFPPPPPRPGVSSRSEVASIHPVVLATGLEGTCTALKMIHSNAFLQFFFILVTRMGFEAPLSDFRSTRSVFWATTTCFKDTRSEPGGHA